MKKDPLDVVFETSEESLAHYLRAMPESLWKVFQREFMRRPTQDAQDGACALCSGEVVDSIPAFCKQCRVQDPPRL